MSSMSHCFEMLHHFLPQAISQFGTVPLKSLQIVHVLLEATWLKQLLDQLTFLLIKFPDHLLAIVEFRFSRIIEKKPGAMKMLA